MKSVVVILFFWTSQLYAQPVSSYGFPFFFSTWGINATYAGVRGGTQFTESQVFSHWRQVDSSLSGLKVLESRIAGDTLILRWDYHESTFGQICIWVDVVGSAKLIIDSVAQQFRLFEFEEEFECPKFRGSESNTKFIRMLNVPYEQLANQQLQATIKGAEILTFIDSLYERKYSDDGGSYSSSSSLKKVLSTMTDANLSIQINLQNTYDIVRAKEQCPRIYYSGSKVTIEPFSVDGQVTINNMLGRAFACNPSITGTGAEIDISFFPAGVYWLLLDRRIHKFVKF